MKTVPLKGILFVSFFFSFFVMLFGLSRYSMIGLFVFSFLFFFVTGVALHVLFNRVFSPQMKRRLSGCSLGVKLYNSCSDRKLMMILWFLISLSFLPAFLALFPGTFGYDAPIQAAQYFGEMELTSANPLLHTCLLGLFLSLGESILKNASLGLALFTLIQGLLVTQVLARSLLFLKKLHTPFTVIAGGFLWIVLNPTLHILTFNVTKDILFGVCFLHFFINLLETICSTDTIKPNFPTGRFCFTHPCLRLLISGSIMCLMRNAAIYLAVLLAVILIFFLRQFRETIFSLCMIFLISRLLSLFFAQGLHIPTGNARENMSIPIQQLAAVCSASVCNTEPANITTQQLDTVQEILPVESWDTFQQDTADPMKAFFDTEAFSKDSEKYISLYLTVGSQNPGIYIRAFRNLVLSYLDMGRSVRRGLALEETFPGISHLTISRYGLFPKYYSFLEKQLQKKNYFPPMQPGISIYLIVIGTGVSIERKSKKMLLCILPAALYFCGLLLGPIALLRYLFPMMLTTPLLFGILFWKEAAPTPFS